MSEGTSYHHHFTCEMCGGEFYTDEPPTDRFGVLSNDGEVSSLCEGCGTRVYEWLRALPQAERTHLRQEALARGNTWPEELS